MMINNIKWDLLQASDIEVRVGGKIKDTDNISLLLYQDSRCTARNLDKQFGAFGWQIDYKVVGEQIYGTLSIWDEEKKEWVSKSDTGDKSNISEDKGQSSDILKRCAVRWGFGTELYTAPKIVVPNDGYNCTGYKVSEINYNENKEIIHLVIVNRFGKVVFNWNIGDNTTTPAKPTTTPKDNLEWTPDDNLNSGYSSPVQMQPKSNLDKLIEFCATRKSEPNTDKSKLTRFYNYYSPKMNEWKGKLDLDALYQRWMTN